MTYDPAAGENGFSAIPADRLNRAKCGERSMETRNDYLALRHEPDALSAG